MFRGENESFLGVNNELLLSEEVFTASQDSQEVPADQSSQKLSPSTVEILPSSEALPILESQVAAEIPDRTILELERKGVKGWLVNEIDKAKEKLTAEERKKVQISLRLWRDHGIISTIGFLAGLVSGYLSISQKSKLYSLINIVPGTIRLGTVLVAEKKHGIHFHWTSKVLSAWFMTPSGLAMPLEIVRTLGKSQVFRDYLKNHYIKRPLRRFRNVFQR